MKKIWFTVRLGVVILLYILAVRYGVLAQTSADTATVMLEGGGLTGEEAEEICTREAEQDIPRQACFWGERENAALSCKETGGSSVATEIAASGKQELVVPGGSVPILEQGDCLIDRDTAWELFRTDYAVGQTLWCDGRAYRVCGTFESLERTFIRMARQNSLRQDSLTGISSEEGASDGTTYDIKLDHLSLKTDRDDDTEQFLMRYGLTGARIDFTFLNILARDLLALLPLVLAGKLLWLLVKDFLRATERQGRKVFIWLACAVVIFAVLYFLSGNIRIPADMIPTKWSDFSFWTDWWDGQCKNFLRMLGSAQGEVQLMMLWRLLISVICNMAGIILALMLPDKNC